jgi:hypothetical protein
MAVKRVADAADAAVVAADVVVVAARLVSQALRPVAMRSKRSVLTISMTAHQVVFPSTWRVAAAVVGDQHRRSLHAERSAPDRRASPTRWRVHTRTTTSATTME